MDLKMNNGRINIDGREFSGSSITIDGDGVVIIDGIKQNDSVVGVVNITVHGDVEKLENKKGTVTAQNVGTLKTVQGDVVCWDVYGDVQTVQGDVQCHSIGGNVKTTHGDINHR